MTRGEPATRRGGFVTQTLLVLAKDLRVELRSREIVYTMVFFAVLVVLIFSFAFALGDQPANQVAGGILWVVIAFAGTLGLGRFFDRERENDTQRALLLCPVPRPAVFVGKLLGILLFILVTEAVVLPLLVVLFELRIASVGLLLGLLLAGSLGYAAVGALFAASLMRARSRDVLLGIMLFPIVTPVIVGGAKGTAILLGDPSGAGGAVIWLNLLVVFDLVFVTLGMWAFGPLTRSD
jgi:heme exporter protein CcmB